MFLPPLESTVGFLSVLDSVFSKCLYAVVKKCTQFFPELVGDVWFF